MASTSLNLFSAILLLILLSKGMSQRCSTNDLQISQDKTGVLVQAQPEFEVKVLNACPCLQGNVKLGCNGFQTTDEVNPLTLLKSGNECLLNNGSSLIPFSQISFKYAWDTQFSFKPVSSEINCN
ncbi:PREDICTED: uncharacterized protein At1g05835-like [Prunus mume]|uniref:Uncharacterized protein At1g05835-like n=1 Tax=Prunus mume TaxID=102107 RepID=A0ABM0N561_PRUMU|nr:PREDICTED: uncharacterized protein At1g05835-like [Prunus mume]